MKRSQLFLRDGGSDLCKKQFGFVFVDFFVKVLCVCEVVYSCEIVLRNVGNVVEFCQVV